MDEVVDMPDAIVTEVRVSWDRLNYGVRMLRVACPFCGKVHTHGGGIEGQEPLEPLGSRVSHCHRGEYRLVLDEKLSAATRSRRTGRDDHAIDYPKRQAGRPPGRAGRAAGPPENNAV